MRLLAVNYHYYRANRPSAGIYPISPKRFAEQISRIGAEWTIAAERQMIEALAGAQKSDIRLCLVTFDDGLKEQMQAIRSLASQNLSAMCYVPTAPLVERRVFGVHKLHIIRTLRADADLVASLSSRFGHLFAATDRVIAAGQYPYDSDDAQQVKYFLNFVLDEDGRAGWIDKLFGEIAGDEAAAAAALYMDHDDVRELARLGMLGTHSHSHLPLATLDEGIVRREIGRSIDILEDVTGTRVRGISYPYGGATAVNETVGRVAAEFGLSYGLTMRNGINGAAEFGNPMLLARIDTNDVPAYLSSERLKA